MPKDSFPIFKIWRKEHQIYNWLSGRFWKVIIHVLYWNLNFMRIAFEKITWCPRESKSEILLQMWMVISDRQVLIHWFFSHTGLLPVHTVWTPFKSCWGEVIMSGCWKDKNGGKYIMLTRPKTEAKGRWPS